MSFSSPDLVGRIQDHAREALKRAEGRDASSDFGGEQLYLSLISDPSNNGGETPARNTSFDALTEKVFLKWPMARSFLPKIPLTLGAALADPNLRPDVGAPLCLQPELSPGSGLYVDLRLSQLFGQPSGAAAMRYLINPPRHAIGDIALYLTEQCTGSRTPLQLGLLHMEHSSPSPSRSDRLHVLVPADQARFGAELMDAVSSQFRSELRGRTVFGFAEMVAPGIACAPEPVTRNSRGLSFNRARAKACELTTLEVMRVALTDTSNRAAMHLGLTGDRLSEGRRAVLDVAGVPAAAALNTFTRDVLPDIDPERFAASFEHHLTGVAETMKLSPSTVAGPSSRPLELGGA